MSLAAAMTPSTATSSIAMTNLDRAGVDDRKLTSHRDVRWQVVAPVIAGATIDPAPPLR